MAFPSTSHNVSQLTTSYSKDGNYYHTTSHRDTAAANKNPPETLSVETQAFLRQLFFESLSEYKAATMRIITETRIQLASSTDSKNTSDIILRISEDAKARSSAYFEKQRDAVHFKRKELPFAQAKAMVDSWALTSEKYMRYTEAFDNELWATIRVLIELNSKVLKECNLLAKEVDAIYAKAMN